MIHNFTFTLWPYRRPVDLRALCGKSKNALTRVVGLFATLRPLDITSIFNTESTEILVQSERASLNLDETSLEYLMYGSVSMISINSQWTQGAASAFHVPATQVKSKSVAMPTRYAPKTEACASEPGNSIKDLWAKKLNISSKPLKLAVVADSYGETE